MREMRPQGRYALQKLRNWTSWTGAQLTEYGLTV